MSKLFEIPSDVVSLENSILTESEFEEVQSEFFLQSELSKQNTNGEKILVALEAIETLINLKKTNQKIGLEAYDYTGGLLSLNTSQSGSVLLNHHLSLEDLISRREKFWQSLLLGFANWFEKLVEAHQHAFSLFEFQSKRLLEIKKKLEQHPNETKTIVLRSNKWLRRGNKRNSVNDFNDYKKEIIKVNTSLTLLNKVIVDLVDKDLLSWFKWVHSGLTGNTEQFVNERVKSASKTFENLISDKNFKAESSDALSTFYATDILLGIFQIEVKAPTKELYLDFLKFNFYRANVERAEKFYAPSIISTGEKVELEFNKMQALELCRLAESLLDTTNKLGEIKPRLHSASKLADFTLTPILSLSNSLLKIVTESGRVMESISGTTTSCTAASYNIGFGNINQILNILEKYVD